MLVHCCSVVITYSSQPQLQTHGFKLHKFDGSSLSSVIKIELDMWVCHSTSGPVWAKQSPEQKNESGPQFAQIYKKKFFSCQNKTFLFSVVQMCIVVFHVITNTKLAKSGKHGRWWLRTKVIGLAQIEFVILTKRAYSIKHLRICNLYKFVKVAKFWL